MELEADGIAVRYKEPRPLSPEERKHPLAESGWQVCAHTTLEGAVDTLLIAKNGKHRLLELYDDYLWAQERRALNWDAFIVEETERGDRKGWLESIEEKIDVYGFCVPNPKVWVAKNDDFGADWMIALEF
jgi:hypothetical protein